MFKQLLFPIALTLTALQPSTVIAQPDPAGTHHGNINKTVQREAWLGLTLETIPPILRSQLGAIIPERQGVIITSVLNNSPAEKSGLQKHDIILNVGDEKIYSPRQLAELIKATPPESDMHLTIVRQSKVMEITATLGAHDRLARPQWPQPGQRWSMPPIPDFQAPGYPGNNQTTMSWDSFESVQVNTLPDGRYHAEVKYKDPQGNQKGFTFEGNRDEIVSQINQQKDLPPAKKQALLNALDMNPNAIFKQPFFQGRNFNDDPFADPFFQQGFPGWNVPDLQRFFQTPGTNRGIAPRRWRGNPPGHPPVRPHGHPDGSAYRPAPGVL
ncbi:MAG TPA: PDZ domain-containing protein [Gammaproteobacteria bacterium]|nr:PDZ domain-containing protein [Gammaproteobacteria bacterium]